MQIAHELGLKSSATMMFGHVETIADRIEHLQRLRDQQDRAGIYRVYLLDVSARKYSVEN
jgi:cyclic dehypoxanthinyl futalosine synthase